MDKREKVAKALQVFWQGKSGRTWEKCCETLPEQADWFRRLADVAIKATEGDESD
jgi:hypothetical protein